MRSKVRADEAGGDARVLELRAVQVAEERLRVVGEGGEHEVEPPVAVVVAGVGAHSRLGAALGVHRDAAQQPHALEAAAALVVVEEVRVRVVGHEQVDLAVAVVVGRQHAEAVGLRRVGEAGGRRGLDEGPVAAVQEEEVLLARQPGRADHDVRAVAPDERALRADHVVPGGLHVARDVEVEVPVAVGVEERAARAPARSRDAGRGRHVLEGAVALVAEEEVRAPVGHVEVEPTVAVEVARADAVAPGGGVDAGLLRDVLELEPAPVAVEGVPVRHALAALRELGRGHQVDVEEPVAVVVEERDAAAARLEDVVLRGAAAVALRREAGDRLELHRRGSARGRVLPTPSPGPAPVPSPRRGPRRRAPSPSSGCSCPGGSGRARSPLRAGRAPARGAPDTGAASKRHSPGGGARLELPRGATQLAPLGVGHQGGVRQGFEPAGRFLELGAPRLPRHPGPAGLLEERHRLPPKLQELGAAPGWTRPWRGVCGARGRPARQAENGRSHGQQWGCGAGAGAETFL